MDTRSGSFRVYRVVDSVKHLNLQAVGEPQLYSVYETGYPESQQAAVDALTTGDLVDATLEGDPAAATEAWRVTEITRQDRVPFGFAVDLGLDGLPEPARSLATEHAFDTPQAPTDPVGTPLSHQGTVVGECWLQPRESLPNKAFVPSVLTGLLPLEPWLQNLPHAEAPADQVLVLDPAPPTAETFSVPFGVFLFFTTAGDALASTYRDQYHCPRGTDSRPDFDPYH